MLMTDSLLGTVLNHCRWCTGVGATLSIAGERAATVSAGAGATYSITGEIDMGCETETSIVKCVLADRVLKRSCLEQIVS